jgi:hypothetical protein
MLQNISDNEDRIQRQIRQNTATVLSDLVVSPLFTTIYQYRRKWNARILIGYSYYKSMKIFFFGNLIK